jgi:hypothetical protein
MVEALHQPVPPEEKARTETLPQVHAPLDLMAFFSTSTESSRARLAEASAESTPARMAS